MAVVEFDAVEELRAPPHAGRYCAGAGHHDSGGYMPAPARASSRFAVACAFRSPAAAADRRPSSRGRAGRIGHAALIEAMTSARRCAPCANRRRVRGLPRDTRRSHRLSASSHARCSVHAARREAVSNSPLLVEAVHLHHRHRPGAPLPSMAKLPSSLRGDAARTGSDRAAARWGRLMAQLCLTGPVGDAGSGVEKSVH